MEPENTPDVHDKLMAVLKRRGFIQPSYEIYGGVAGFFDYGPLGANLKRNLETLWRAFYVVQEGMAEIECPTVSPEQVFRASGHLEKFADTVIECPACKNGLRGDHLLRSEWQRVRDEAVAVLKRYGPIPQQAMNLIDGNIHELRSSADTEPTPENLLNIIDGHHVAFKLADYADDNMFILWGGSSEPTKYPPIDRSVMFAPRKVFAHFWRGGVYIQEWHAGRAPERIYDIRITCLACGAPIDAGEVAIEAFNLMFRTQVGPGSGRVGYMRPETAQGMFMDFDWLHRYHREKLPFGAVQIGRAYRNEISPRQSLLRLREFSQMEAEVFFDPATKTWPGPLDWADVELPLLARETDRAVPMKAGEAVRKGVVANDALAYFLALTQEFLVAAGIRRERLRFRQHERTEMAHYSSDTWDAEFWSPRFGWVEIVGVADRTDYDLKAHERVSGVPLRAKRRLAEPREVPFREYVPDFRKFGPLYKGRSQTVGEALKATPVAGDGTAAVTVTVDGDRIEVPPELFTVREGTRREEFEDFTPHVVEPSYGVDRIFYAVLESAWHEGEWVTLRLPAVVAPLKVGVFPLMPKDGLDDEARRIERLVRGAGLVTGYDDTGSIGKRYARADEAGVPFCVTVDYESLREGTVTVRDRDSAAQARVRVADLPARLQDLVAGRTTVAELAR